MPGQPPKEAIFGPFMPRCPHMDHFWLLPGRQPAAADMPFKQQPGNQSFIVFLMVKMRCCVYNSIKGFTIRQRSLRNDSAS